MFGTGYGWWVGLLENVGPSYYRVSSPVQITTELNWSSIVSDSNVAGAINTDGELWVWGSNQVGSLGQNQGSPAAYASPVQVPGTWSDFGTGSHSVRAIKTDGTLWCWGYNYNGQLGQNTNAAPCLLYTSPSPRDQRGEPMQ